MSGREWKPGDVQVVLSMHPSRVQELAVWLRGCATSPSARILDYAEQIEAQGHGARLVVIDPRPDAEHLVKHLRGCPACGPSDDWCGALADQIEAQTAPPKPDEPTGLGAVVESEDGRRWVRSLPDGGPAKWLLVTFAPVERAYVWSAIPAVRVLSEGVTP